VGAGTGQETTSQRALFGDAQRCVDNESAHNTALIVVRQVHVLASSNAESLELLSSHEASLLVERCCDCYKRESCDCLVDFLLLHRFSVELYWRPYLRLSMHSGDRAAGGDG